MSKRILAVALVLGILATSNAFASRSRTSVLGTGDAGLFLNGGSFFYDDARNIFYNPSYVNDFKNWGIIEKSNFPAGTAEGGFVTSISTFNLGLYVNREVSVMNSVGNMATVASGAQRPIELFFGGDASNVKWGLGLTYAMANAPGQTDTNMIIHAGVQVADFEPFGWVSVIGNENIATAGTTTKYKQYGFGLRYKMGEWLPYAAWKQDKVTDTKSDVWLVGLGRTTKIGEGARMNYAVGFVRRTGAAGGRSVLPIDVSVEADANSWLTARAGLSHSLYDRTDATGTTAANTTGRIGMGIHLGKADMDFTIAKAATPFAQAEEVGGLNSQVVDIGNGFFSQLSVGYHW